MKIVNSYEYQKLRGITRKFELIKLKGGCCERCGYEKNLAGFDFHHKDPSQKSHQLDMRHLSNTTMAKLLIEVEKCELLCANCHREFHSPDLEMSKIKLLLENIDEKILEVKKVGKPKCVDCGQEINYSYKRCVKCSVKNKQKVERPSLETLLKEVEDHSKQWCAKKYGVSRTSISRWIK